MSDFESALLTHILDNKDIRTVISQKITVDFFFDPNCRAAFSFLLKWFSNPLYSDVPSWESFSASFADFQPIRLEESAISICDQLRSRRLYQDMAEVIQGVGESMTGDPKEGFDLLKTSVSELQARHTVDDAHDLRSMIGDLRDEYFAMKEDGSGLKGKPYPWPALNNATMGLQDEQLVFLYGRPKSKKTWCLLEILRSLHATGARPLLFSQELSTVEIARRVVALATNVDYGLYLRGALEPDVEEEFLEALEVFVEQESFMISRLTTTGPAAVLEMQAKIDEYGATVAAVDGVHYLGSDWKEMGIVLKGLKNTARVKHVPILGTTHANKSRGKTGTPQDDADDFAHADAFAQDCDLALRVVCGIEHRRAREVEIFTAAMREGSPTLFKVHMHLATDLTQKSEEKLESEEDFDSAMANTDGESDIPDEDPSTIAE